ncbi:MAG: glycosyltransferase family 2 protein [Cellulosilyticaceae bacterium]
MGAIEIEQANNKTVLIGSPICRTFNILREFLVSLMEMEKDGFNVEYYFVDDNDEIESSRLLEEFRNLNANVSIIHSNETEKYQCDDYTHRWNEEMIQKVARFKNIMIEYAIEKKYDYLFLIDSDIVLHPSTLKQLVKDQKNIVSNIFWTKWGPNEQDLPQVWQQDAYNFYRLKTNQVATQEELKRWSQEFIDQLRKPGVYQVGGLGACTLIDREALLKGVNFNDIYNVSFWGEDRHFCIRAVALGLELFVDTYYPAYHIYRQEELAGVARFKAECPNRDVQILGAHIMDLIVAGVNSLNTYHYEEGLSEEFKQYFTTGEADSQWFMHQKFYQTIVKEKCINRCNVKEISMAFEGDLSNVLCQIKYCNNGYKKELSYYEERVAEAKVEKQLDGTYLISYFKRGERLSISNRPMIRKVAEVPKLTLSMIVKNEECRYLQRVLLAAREYIDNAVIIDDGSTDRTAEICKEVLGDKLTTLIVNKESKFADERRLRKQQWNATIATNPDWIIFLDADEIFEDRAKEVIRELIRSRDVDIYNFRLYDFWSETHYRQDDLWCAHHTFRPFMMRYQPNYQYQFTETAQHCGRMPSNISGLLGTTSDLRLKHYGWAREEDRIKKYQRYMALDPEGQFGSMPQYQSILDTTVSLMKWNELNINA